MTKLRDICRFQSGGTPSRGTPAYFNGNVPWITTVALNGDVIDGNQAIEWITDEAIAKSAAKIVPPHSVMVGTRVGIGKVAINSVPMSTSQDIISLIGIDENKWDKKFICHLITANKEHLTSQARGATIKGIKIEAIADLVLPEISLEEQARISEVIGKVDALMHMHQQMAMNLEQLIKSRFIELFGDCLSNPKGWKTKCLEDIADVGSSKRVFVEELREDGIPFFRGTEVGALSEGKSVSPELFITEEHYAALCSATGAPQIGDLLMPSICPDGRIWVVNTDKPFYFKDGRVLWIHAIDASFNSTFLLYSLKDRIMTDYSSIASGTTFAELKIFALKKCKVFATPLTLQNEFAAFVEQTDKSKYYSSLSFRYCQAAENAYRQEWITCRTSDF